MPKVYSDTVKKLVREAKEFAEQKKRKGWTRKDFVEALKVFLETGEDTYVPANLKEKT